MHIWLIVFGLLLGFLAGSLWSNSDGQDAATLSISGNDVHELVDKLREHNLYLYYVEDRSGTPAYFTEDPRPVQELSSLPTIPRYCAKWKGTVRVFSTKPSGTVLDTSGWREFGYVIGNFKVFGDPALVQRIREVVEKG